MPVIQDNVGVPTHRRLETAQSLSEERAGADGEFTMRQVVTLTGVGEHALRFYERMGLLAPVHRQASSGHRRYTVSDVSTIETLACLRAAGMSLAQMRAYLDLVPQGAEAAPQAQVILAAQRAALEAQLRTVQERLAYLDHKITYWRAVEAHDERAVEELAQRFAARLRATAHGQPTPLGASKEERRTAK